jgi:hypothetical protein
VIIRICHINSCMQMLKQENKSAMEAFREVLEKVEQSHTQFTVDML